MAQPRRSRGSRFPTFVGTDAACVGDVVGIPSRRSGASDVRKVCAIGGLLSFPHAVVKNNEWGARMGPPSCTAVPRLEGIRRGDLARQRRVARAADEVQTVLGDVVVQ